MALRVCRTPRGVAGAVPGGAGGHPGCPALRRSGVSSAVTARLQRAGNDTRGFLKGLSDVVLAWPAVGPQVRACVHRHGDTRGHTDTSPATPQLRGLAGLSGSGGMHTHPPNPPPPPGPGQGLRRPLPPPVRRGGMLPCPARRGSGAGSSVAVADPQLCPGEAQGRPPRPRSPLVQAAGGRVMPPRPCCRALPRPPRGEIGLPPPAGLAGGVPQRRLPQARVGPPCPPVPVPAELAPAPAPAAAPRSRGPGRAETPPASPRPPPPSEGMGPARARFHPQNG